MASAAPDRPLVLITGSSGLIGSRVVKDLVRDHRVVGLDAVQPKDLPEGAHHIFCDLTDDASVREALAQVEGEHGHEIASVVHLAAYYDFSGEPSHLYNDLTVEGTRRLLEGLRRFNVEQLIFSSTLLVMKPAEPGELITEDSPVQGEWDYPQSKLKAEELIRNERGPISAVILRLAGAYDERGHSPPITQQIYRIYERTLESHVFPGDQERGQPFVHLHDVVSAFRKTIEHRHELGGYEVFLIAEPEVATYADLQNTLGKLIHGEDAWLTLRVPTPVAKAGAWVKDQIEPEESFIKPWMIDLADAHYPTSCEKARRLLDWEPQHRLLSELGAMVRELKRDPEGFYKENGLPQ